jgi:hypothetical protein
MRAPAAILSIVALAACSSQTDKQLEAVKSARSVLSEWALVERQAAQGQAQTIYLEQMRHDSKDELKKASTALSRQREAARLIDGLCTGTPGTDALERAAAALEPLEKRLEAA